MSSSALERLSLAELEAESGAVLPAKEVLSVPLLDLTADINLALDLAAPIDLAIAGNANVVLPINAAVSANALSVLSTAQAGGEQAVGLDQFISGHAVAHGDQTSGIDQTPTAAAGTGPTLGALGSPAYHPPVGTGADLAPATDAPQAAAGAAPHVVESAPPAPESTTSGRGHERRLRPRQLTRASLRQRPPSRSRLPLSLSTRSSPSTRLSPRPP